MSEKKIRIHELAKRYGLSGKDCAAKLRDCGFSKAKSHMTALDQFEELQATGLLEANGFTPVSAGGEDSGAAVGGVKVKKKLKKKQAEEAPREEPEPRPTPPVETTPEPEATEPAPVEPTPTPSPAEAPVEEAPSASEPETEPAPRPEPTAEAPEPEPSPATREEAPPEPSSAEPTAAEPAPEPSAQEPGVAPEEPASPASPEGGEAPEPEPTPAAGAQEPVAEADTGPAVPAEDEVEAVGDPQKKAGAGPRGKITGFIDPQKLQQAQPRRRSESRRLKSRDDVAPDVRPSFAGRGGRSGGGQATGGKKLTASQLREREQGRFLRRQGRRTGGGKRGGRSAGPRVREEVNASPLAGGEVTVEAPVTMAKLAEALKLKAAVVIKKAMFSQLGMFTNNALLDDEEASLIANEFDVTLHIKQEVTAEEQHLEEVKKKRSEVEEEELVQRAPTVAFLGHVDHGKTTLIDKIRETHVVEAESGGITQHIGAYQVETAQGHRITIIDTPGHQAFTAMRARGANAVDIVVLVVAGDDGVKPSTEEAINHARAAGTPIVVALNKKDKPGFNANAAIQQLMGHELVPEQYGGHTAFFETSGMTGEGIEELLEYIFLMGEAEIDLRAHPKGPASGVVLEAQVEQGRGVVAHLLLQDGTLNQGEVILAGEGYGRVRSIHDDRGNVIERAGPSFPVEVTGLAALPGVGDPFYVVDSLDKAKEVATERERSNRAIAHAANRGANKELERILGSKPKQNVEVINLIVRADVQGSIEAIRSEVEKLQHEEVEVKLVHTGVGPITESDVSLAVTSNALLVAFHVGVHGKARQEAERFGLDIRRYDVIYEMLDDLRDAMEGALSPDYEEEILGHAEIRRLFKSSRIGLIAGCYVLDGRIRRSSKIRLLRDDTVVHTGEIASLRRETDDVKDVREGFECGIVLKDYRDIREGDVVEAFTLKEIKRKLGD